MFEIALILKVMVVFFSVIALISYGFRKSDSKHALRELEFQAPVRSLTSEEFEMVSAFAASKKLKLVSPSVYGLEGAYCAHGISVNNAPAQMFDLIGGVEVVFPYDLKIFVEGTFNNALVVRAAKQVIVIELNGATLVEASERARVKAQEDEVWRRGEVGLVRAGEDGWLCTARSEGAVGEGDAVEGDAVEGEGDGGRGGSVRTESEVFILSQREESPEEVQSRVGGGFNFASVGLWCLAVVFFLVANASGSVLVLTVVACVLAVAGLVLFFKRPDYLKDARQVNVVRGSLTAGVGFLDAEQRLMSSRLQIGGRFELVFPSYWLKALKVSVGDEVQAEVRVVDNAVVGLGKQWSVAEEVRRFKPYYWGRYFLAALVGLGCVVLHSCCTDGVKYDDDLAGSYFLGGARLFSTAQEVLASPPAVGDYVVLQGQARCEFFAEQSDVGVLPGGRCDEFRWGGEVGHVPALNFVFPEAFHAFLSDDLFDVSVRQVPNPNSRDYGAYGYYGGGYRPRLIEVVAIRDFDASLSAIDEACEAGLEGCDELKSRILSILSDDVLVSPVRDWESLVRLAAPGNSLNGFIFPDNETVGRLREAVEKTSAGVYAKALGSFSEDFLKGQQGGVLLSFVDGGVRVREDSLAMSGSHLALNGVPGFVQELRRYVEGGGVKVFDVDGVVVEAGEREGTPRFVVDVGLNAGEAMHALNRMLMLIFGWLLLVVCGVLCVFNFWRKCERDKALEEYVGQLPQPNFIFG